MVDVALGPEICVIWYHNTKPTSNSILQLFRFHSRFSPETTRSSARYLFGTSNHDIWSWSLMIFLSSLDIWSQIDLLYMP